MWRADGKRYLIIHGDLFDVVIRNARWLALLGNKAYDFAIMLNTHFNTMRRLLGLPYWSLSRWIKLKVKNAVNFIGEFEKTLSTEGRRHHVDGVVCGHIHHPVIRDIDGLTYVNCGDWVESCTAAVEHFDGQLEIIEWSKARPARRRRALPASGEVPARTGRAAAPRNRAPRAIHKQSKRIGLARTAAVTYLTSNHHIVGRVGERMIREARSAAILSESASRQNSPGARLHSSHPQFIIHAAARRERAVGN